MSFSTFGAFTLPLTGARDLDMSVVMGEAASSALKRVDPCHLSSPCGLMLSQLLDDPASFVKGDLLSWGLQSSGRPYLWTARGDDLTAVLEDDDAFWSPWGHFMRQAAASGGIWPWDCALVVIHDEEAQGFDLGVIVIELRLLAEGRTVHAASPADPDALGLRACRSRLGWSARDSVPEADNAMAEHVIELVS